MFGKKVKKTATESKARIVPIVEFIGTKTGCEVTLPFDADTGRFYAYRGKSDEDRDSTNVSFYLGHYEIGDGDKPPQSVKITIEPSSESAPEKPARKKTLSA
jgi:hypothetical protein